MDGFNSDFEIGSKIRLFTLDDDIFEGILQYWDKSNEKGKLVLSNGKFILSCRNSKLFSALITITSLPCE